MNDVSLIDGHIDNRIKDNEIISVFEDLINSVKMLSRTDKVILNNTLIFIKSQKAEIERLRQQPLYDFYKEKSKTIKEFAERLKEKAILYNLYNNEDYYKMVDVEDIDNLVKEMTESKKY